MKRINNRDGFALMLTAGSAVMASAAETAEESVAAEATAEQTAAAAVSLSANSALLGVGESLTLTATAADGAAVSWESSDTAVVTVSEGVLTATGSGKATVTAATETGTAACVVTVQPAPMGISLNSEGVTLGVNEKFDIDVSYTNPDCVRKTYYAVDNTGVRGGPITALSPQKQRARRLCAPTPITDWKKPAPSPSKRRRPR